jgi:hypothetical protein
VALQPPDFGVLHSKGGSMVWSPFSNLLLYGQTADVGAAKATGTVQQPFKIGIGSDWSPSGSKSLFGELKVAHVYSEHNGNVFSDAELVRLATLEGAEILDWDKLVGSIEVGKRADLLVVAGQDDANPHGPLLRGDERQVQLVSINGTPRYGTPAMMVTDGPHIEALEVGGEQRVLYLKQATEDPDVSALSFAEAQGKLKDALLNIKEIRQEQESKQAPEALATAPELRAGRARLALDEFEHTDFTQRPHLPLEGAPSGPTDREPTAAAPPISSLLSPIDLDPLTLADDSSFLGRVAAEINLPEYVASGLLALYRG